MNFDKVSPVTFILMPLLLLSKSTSSKYRRVEEPILTETLAHFRDVQITKHDFGDLPQSLEGCKVYFQEGETDKIYQFLTGFQQAEKTLYKDVANAVDEVRSGRLDQSQLVDIIRTFSCGGYSKDSLKAFHDSSEPMLQKLMFFDKLRVIHEGVIIVGESQTVVNDITCNSDVYILYATESAKQQHPRV